jgi:hypothetical protein
MTRVQCTQHHLVEAKKHTYGDAGT